MGEGLRPPFQATLSVSRAASRAASPSIAGLLGLEADIERRRRVSRRQVCERMVSRDDCDGATRIERKSAERSGARRCD